jgi:hypothetical protein
MTADDLKNRIESSTDLRRVRDALTDEVAFRAADSTRLDPITILTIISIVIQIVVHCREKNPDEEIVDLIRNSRTIPRRKTILLRRKLREYARDNNISDDNVQNIYDAIMDMGENATDSEITEIMQISRECE